MTEPIDIGDLLSFLGRASSWTCGACGKYGRGFASWREHEQASPECEVENARIDARRHVHIDMRPEAVSTKLTDADRKTGGMDTVVSAMLNEAPMPVARFWTVVDVNGNELRPRERRAYLPGAEWVVYVEADRVHALAFSETASSPIFLTVPVGRAVKRGDRITIAGPASGGEFPVNVDTRRRAVCELTDCDCSGEAHA